MLKITMITAALLAFVNIWLAARVIQTRTSARVATGDAGHPGLLSRMRAHANFNEYVPLAVILMGLVEYAGGQHRMLVAAGGVLLAARIAHPLGMDRPSPNVFRAGGMLGTVIVTLGLAGWALAIAYS